MILNDDSSSETTISLCQSLMNAAQPTDNTIFITGTTSPSIRFRGAAQTQP
jgi:hypothetical protein